MTSKNVFPENFIKLHEGEESLRKKSLESINLDKDLLHHFFIIESSMDIIDYFARTYEHEDKRQLIVQHLGIQLFNGSASAIKLLLSGYYQSSASIQRNLLEIMFLLDYFTMDKDSILKWHEFNEQERKNHFSPVKIREALDKRDGLKEHKRKKAYQNLCNLAAHPTPKSFNMIRSIPNGDAHCGPFFELTVIKATLEELVKIMIEAAEKFNYFFTPKVLDDYKTKIIFMEGLNGWSAKFFKNDLVDQSSINEIKNIISKLETDNNFT